LKQKRREEKGREGKKRGKKANLDLDKNYG